MKTKTDTSIFLLVCIDDLLFHQTRASIINGRRTTASIGHEGHSPLLHTAPSVSPISRTVD